MKKKSLVIIFSAIAVTLVSGVLFVNISRAGDKVDITQTKPGSIVADASDADQTDYTYIPPIPEDNTQSPSVVPTPTEEPEEPFVPDFTMDLDPSSITVFINKEYALPKNYEPEELVTPNVYFHLAYYDQRTLMRPEAAEALEKLFDAGAKDGYVFCGVSGYRSYSRQRTIFTNNIVAKGKDYTLQYSAVPGTSEHQTGLAIDVSTESLKYNLSTKFAETPEGVWLADNAHRFGYIVRYPKGKASITGYAYEPWHIRYVGKGLATYLYENQLTLDEYYNYTPSEGFDFEALYAELINFIPPTIIPIDGEGVVIGENGEIIDGLPGDELEPGEETDVPEPGEEEDPLDPGEEAPAQGEETTAPGEVDPGDNEENNTSTEGDNGNEEGAPTEEPVGTDPDDNSDSSDSNPDGNGPTATPTLSPTPTPDPSVYPSNEVTGAPIPSPIVNN